MFSGSSVGHENVKLPAVVAWLDIIDHPRDAEGVRVHGGKYDTHRVFHVDLVRIIVISDAAGCNLQSALPEEVAQAWVREHSARLDRDVLQMLVPPILIHHA